MTGDLVDRRRRLCPSTVKALFEFLLHFGWARPSATALKPSVENAVRSILWRMSRS
jgi:hypothetical protein